jgi:molybdopterin-binding protein
VLEIVPREGRTEVVLDAAGARLVAVVTRWAVEELALAPGREVQAVFKATACHWVAASG